MWGAADLIQGCSRPEQWSGHGLWYEIRERSDYTDYRDTQIWSPAEYRALASALTGVRSIWSLGHQNEIRLHTLYKKSRARDLRD